MESISFEDLLFHKSNANTLYQKGCELLSNNITLENSYGLRIINGQDKLKQSCVEYGELINKIIYFEEMMHTTDKTVPQPPFDLIENLSVLKPTVFLNLAASNLKLKNNEGALKCLHAVIQFCNNPNLLMCELEPTDDLLRVNEPVIPKMRGFIIKALYRRGCCFMNIMEYQNAYQDFSHASRLSPTRDEFIERSILDSKSKLTSATMSMSTTVSSNNSNKGSIIMANGGKCWQRQGMWSQTVQEVCYVMSSFLKIK